MSTLERKRNSLRKRQEKSKTKCWCCRKFIAFLFSHVGLCALVAGYTILGAYIFRHYEGPKEKSRRNDIIMFRNETVHQLWTETYKFNVLYKENWTAMATKEIEKFQQLLLEAVKNGYDGTDVSSQWSLSGAWMYSLTVITTIGHVNRPRTDEGKVATIIYAILGIPLMVLFLMNIGNLLAKALKCLYRYCCVCSSDGDTSNNHHHNHHSHHHLHDHYHVHHIALNDVSPSHLIHCNSNTDPYRTANKCYSSAQRDLYGVVPEAETKIGAEVNQISDHHSCGGTLNRAHSHSHHSILKNPTTPTQADHSNLINSHSGHRNEKEETVKIPLLLCFTLIFGYICLGAAIFSMMEGRPFLDGSYFCFVTLSTIGFGDLMPGEATASGSRNSQKKFIVTSAYIIGGLALMAMSFNLVKDQILLKIRKCKRRFGIDTEMETVEIGHHNLDDDFDV